MAEVVITKDNFENEVIDSQKMVLLDFWATWCGPCRMIAPVVEEVAEEYEDILKVGKINVDEEPELANMFNITSIPTLVVFKDGQITDTSLGYKTKEQILALLGI